MDSSFNANQVPSNGPKHPPPSHQAVYLVTKVSVGLHTAPLTVMGVFRAMHLAPSQGTLLSTRVPGRDTDTAFAFNVLDPVSCDFYRTMQACSLIESADFAAPEALPERPRPAWLDIIPEEGIVGDGIRLKVTAYLTFNGTTIFKVTVSRESGEAMERAMERHINLWYPVAEPFKLESIIQATFAIYSFRASPLAHNPIRETAPGVFSEPCLEDTITGWSFQLSLAHGRYSVGGESALYVRWTDEEGKRRKSTISLAEATKVTVETQTITTDNGASAFRARTTFHTEAIVADVVSKLRFVYGVSVPSMPRAYAAANTAFACGATDEPTSSCFIRRAVAYGDAALGVTDETSMAEQEELTRETTETTSDTGYLVSHVVQTRLASDLVAPPSVPEPITLPTEVAPTDGGEEPTVPMPPPEGSSGETTGEMPASLVLPSFPRLF